MSVKKYFKFLGLKTASFAGLYALSSLLSLLPLSVLFSATILGTLKIYRKRMDEKMISSKEFIKHREHFKKAVESTTKMIKKIEKDYSARHNNKTRKILINNFKLLKTVDSMIKQIQQEIANIIGQIMMREKKLKKENFDEYEKLVRDAESLSIFSEQITKKLFEDDEKNFSEVNYMKSVYERSSMQELRNELRTIIKILDRSGKKINLGFDEYLKIKNGLARNSLILQLLSKEKDFNKIKEKLGGYYKESDNKYNVKNLYEDLSKKFEQENTESLFKNYDFKGLRITEQYSEFIDYLNNLRKMVNEMINIEKPETNMKRLTAIMEFMSSKHLGMIKKAFKYVRSVTAHEMMTYLQKCFRFSEISFLKKMKNKELNDYLGKEDILTILRIHEKVLLEVSSIINYYTPYETKKRINLVLHGIPLYGKKKSREKLERINNFKEYNNEFIRILTDEFKELVNVMLQGKEVKKNFYEIIDYTPIEQVERTIESLK